MTVYFDNAATTKPCAEAAAAAAEAMGELYGNPSSTHRLGREARRLLESSRERVAAALGAAAEEIVFTSGGTEGDNWAVDAAWRLKRHEGRHVITSAAEHEAVLQSVRRLEAEGAEVTYLAPDAAGRITADAVAAALRPDTVLVSLMLVNNETGAVTPVGAIARMLRARGSGALLHTDAVQAFLKVPFSPRTLGADMITVSAHKIHGLKGCGALWIRAGLRLPPFVCGGGQERTLRSGTEAMPAIAAFGAAAEAGRALAADAQEIMRALRAYTARRLSAELPDTVFIGAGDAPHILSVAFPGYGSEVLMNCLDADGICVSKSSACRRGARSHVLEAMGLPPAVIDGALRISFSRYSTEAEADALVASLKSATARLRRK